MMKPRLFLIITITILASFLLSACSGGAQINNWPGISANVDAIYVSYQGAVHAINATNGAQFWSFPAEPDPANPFYAAPGLGPDGLVVVGNYIGHTLYALNSKGALVWQFPASGNFAASPLVLENMVLAPASDGMVYALSPEGKLMWEYDTGDTLWAQPASNGELVYVPAIDHVLYAFRLDNGELVWTKDLGSALQSAPVLSDDGNLYITTLDGLVVALDPISGRINWQTPTYGYIYSSPTLQDKTLYVSNTNGDTANSKTGKILALSADDGKILWEEVTDSPMVGGAVVLPDAVVFPSETGKVTAWVLSGGKQLWSQPVNGKLYTTPVVTGDTLAVSVMQGDSLVQAFSTNGQITWTFTVSKKK